MGKHLIYLAFIASGLFYSCNPSSETSQSEEETTAQEEAKEEPNLPIGDNSQTSLDWPGTYFGVLPCASCEGIENWVTLNADGTFELKTNYLGLNDAREEIFTGTFEWDPTGSMVQLTGLIGNAPGKYKVGENRIWHLDQDGNRIEGDLAEFYILQKQ